MPYTLSIPTTTTSSSSSSSSSGSSPAAATATTTDSKAYTLYNLIISTPLRTTTLPKRYSDFASLHSALTDAVGATPPAPLPSKSWFSRTVNNPAMAEERRQGLELYVRAIEEGDDTRWRTSDVWRSFLGFPPGTSSIKSSSSSSMNVGATGVGGVGGGGDGGWAKDVVLAQTMLSASGWLDLHAQLKSLLHEARTLLTRREQASTPVQQQHEASAGAKRCLVKANTLIIRLDEGLKALQEGRAWDRLGDGELRRRRDLLGRARKEREGLDGVLNAWAVRSPTSSTSGTVTSPVFEGQKQRLFAGANTGQDDKSIPGAFPTAAAGRRVLGGPAKETTRTRELDNEGVVQLQRHIMKEQDLDVEDLTKAVRRMKEMGVAINEELVEQGELLDVLDQDVDRVGAKMDIAKKRIRKIN